METIVTPEMSDAILDAYIVGKLQRDLALFTTACDVWNALADQYRDVTTALRYHMNLSLDGSDDSQLVSSLDELATVVPELAPLSEWFH